MLKYFFLDNEAKWVQLYGIERRAFAPGVPPDGLCLDHRLLEEFLTLGGSYRVDQFEANTSLEASDGEGLKGLFHRENSNNLPPYSLFSPCSTFFNLLRVDK